MADSDDEQTKLARVLARYKSTKGDADKRKETSKLNVAKARAAKLAALQATKSKMSSIEESDSDEEMDSEEEDEESDGEELIIAKKSKKGGGRRGGAPPADDRMARLEQMMLQVAMQNKKKAKKKPTRKVVNIQIASPATAQAPVNNPHTAAIKKSIIQWN
jgi:hypothetical protein